MKINHLFFMVAAAGLLLSACGPQAAASPTAAPVGAVPQAVVTESGPAACKAIGFLATPSPALASQYPPVSESDWKMGPENALVTFIEYSDFQ